MKILKSKKSIKKEKLKKTKNQKILFKKHKILYNYKKKINHPKIFLLQIIIIKLIMRILSNKNKIIIMKILLNRNKKTIINNQIIFQW